MLYVLHGPDQVRAREELQKIRAGLDRDGNLAHNTVRLEPRGLSPADLRAACHVASFFAEDRLVILEGLQQRFSGARRRGGRAPAKTASKSTAASDFDQFVDILTTLPPTTTVVLLDDQPQVAFLEGVSNGGATVKEYPLLRAGELRAWAEARVKAQGGSINPQALDRMLTLIDGAHLGELASEIDKLVTYANGRRIESADIDELVSSALQYQIWDLTDAVVAGRADRALGFVETMAARGGRDYAPQLLIFMITRQYRQLILAQAMLAEHLTQQEIGQRLGIFSQFPLRKVIEQAGRYSPERLEAAYRRLLETDVAVKTGVLDVDTALELLIVDLCELAKPPPRRATAARR